MILSDVIPEFGYASVSTVICNPTMKMRRSIRVLDAAQLYGKSVLAAFLSVRGTRRSTDPVIDRKHSEITTIVPAVRNCIRGFVRGFRKLKRKKSPDAWEHRYPDRSQPESPLKAVTYSTADFPTKAAMWQHIDTLLWKLNSNTSQNVSQDLSFGGVCNRYIQDEHLRGIGGLKRGQQNTFGGLKVSTARGYLQIIENHLRPKWGETPVSRMTPALVQDWFRGLPLSQATKAHVKAVFFRLLERAMLWEIIPVQRNPMELVEIKGASKRGKTPKVLTPEQCSLILSILQEPYRTMALTAICTGLRASEILALKGADFDFADLKLRVVRGVVRRIVDHCKTECSEAELPLDAEFAEALKQWMAKCPPSDEGWVFPSPRTGRPYELNLQQKVLRPAGDKLGIPHLGFHSFRHTYRSWLDASGAPMGVQQKLMRHAQVSTTMNVYGDAQMQAKRQANTNAVKETLIKLSLSTGNMGKVAPA
jgi:integrase